MAIVMEYFGALRQVGVLNHADFASSGEATFLDVCMSWMKVPVVFDVGANVGDFTREVLARNPRAHVFAFEPHPETFARLRGLDGLANVTAVNAALGATEEVLPLFDYRDGDGSSHASLYRESIETLRHARAVSHPVPVRRLADVAEEHGVGHIDLLKIDTEGHEFAVLQGAEPLIRRGDIDVILFEFNEMNVAARVFFKDFWDFLPEYDFFRLLPDGLLPLRHYVPWLCEVFAYQNIACVRKDSGRL